MKLTEQRSRHLLLVFGTSFGTATAAMLAGPKPQRNIASELEFRPSAFARYSAGAIGYIPRRSTFTQGPFDNAPEYA